MTSSSFSFLVRKTSRAGFTLVELLITIAVTSLLATLLFKALVRSRMTVGSTQCRNNLMQLQVGWHLYAVDHDDTVPPNGWRDISWSDGCPQGYQSAAGSWVMGEAPTDRTDIAIRSGVLFSYIGASATYHCPSDVSKVDGNKKLLRKRSYSASYYMNGSEAKGYGQVKRKFSTIRDPSKAFVFIDEHEQTIDDGVFFLHSPGDVGEQYENGHSSARFGGAHWMSMPSGRHNQGSSLSFPDGHTEHWKWRYPKKLGPNDDRDVSTYEDFRDMRRLQGAIPDTTTTAS